MQNSFIQSCIARFIDSVILKHVKLSANVKKVFFYDSVLLFIYIFLHVHVVFFAKYLART